MVDLVASQVQMPTINGVQSFAQGAQARQQLDASAVQNANAVISLVGQVALGAQGGDINAPADPAKWAQGQALLKAHGLDISGLPATSAPMVARASISALDQIKMAQNQQQLELQLAQYTRQLQAPVALGPGQQLVVPQGPNAGQVVAGSPVQYRALTDPTERAQYGISPDDKTPYQVDQQGKLSYAGGPQSTVNIQNKSEGAFQEAVGKSRGEAYDNIAKAAQAAQNNIQTLGQLGGILSTSGYQGPGGEQVLGLRKAASALGIDVSNTSDAQVAEALSRQLALQYRNPAGGAGMPGSLSDSDRNYLASMAPGLDKTPEANQKLVDALTKVEQRKIEVRAMADRYIADHGTLDSGFDQQVTSYNKDHPIFGGQTNFSNSSNTTSTGVQWSVGP